MKRRTVGAVEEDLIITGGLIIAGYFLLKNAVPSLFGGSSEDKQVITDVNTTSADQNPFSINFQWGLYGQAPSTYNAQWWKGLKDTLLSQQPTGVIDWTNVNTSGVYNYVVQGELIENAFGMFTEDDTTVDNAMSTLLTQADVSNVASYIYFNYGDDLFTLLKNGKSIIPGYSGLSTSHLAQIINHVNSLPSH